MGGALEVVQPLDLVQNIRKDVCRIVVRIVIMVTQ
jgi:hypothetical protein